jgi:hypothetical protein
LIGAKRNFVLRGVKMRTLFLVLTAWAAAALPAAAQPADGDAAKNGAWERLGQVPKTQQVKVYVQGGKTLQGFIQEARPEGLTFIQGTQVSQLARADVLRVTRKSRAKGATIGAIAGGAVGAIFGVLDAGAGHSRIATGVALEGALGVGAFAAIGAAVGAESTLYRAASKWYRYDDSSKGAGNAK